MIEIDGSILEGGGQILRVALSLSCLLRRPIHVFNIRAGRSKPGLAAQHLNGLKLMQQISDAHVEGDFIGSKEIKFLPRAIKSGNYSADTKTAGSIALLLQVALPVLIFTDVASVLDLKGGTNADKAPHIDFITKIFRPNLQLFNASFTYDLHKRGYYPNGGGHFEVIVEPVRKLNPITLTRPGVVTKVFGWSFVAGILPLRMSYEMRNGALEVFNTMELCAPIKISAYREEEQFAYKKCAVIILGCETARGCTIGGSGICTPSDLPTNTGRKAALEIASSLGKGACVDSFTQDQLIIFMALADGVSKIRTTKPTLHTKTAIYVVELMCDAKFKIIDQHDFTFIIECQGIGMENIPK